MYVNLLQELFWQLIVIKELCKQDLKKGNARK